MQKLFHLFLDIALLRKGPQDVPAIQSLLTLSACTYLIVGMIQVLVAGEAVRGIVLTFVEFILLGGFVFGLLSFYKKPERFTQTLIAMLGAGTIIGLVAIPLMPAITSSNEQLSVLPFLLYLTLISWSVMVSAFILQHALGISRQLGVAWSMGYLVFFIILSGIFFPVSQVS